ncbi:hypothetical protein CROQUDRAFT_654606 [Cronartium quercuum f. sp. fusiforme G11]|uniref:K Homology domain-containing protein n=1 Tax=Cronartium quercuum f. sp. fusiforme G11 TaxID=708437 RepID=A0A9P6NNF3_9BASI|nr:hypothetical protein CROQUDRAFT_654606 [Cronartium quercuum f. sp. fusiforme G11]
MEPNPTTNGDLSTAERLMLQHQQSQTQPNGNHHLSYDEMRASSGNPPEPSTSGRPKSVKQPDMDSETAFPSLGTPSAAPKTAGGWGSGPALGARLGGGASGVTTATTNAFTETLVLFLSSIHIGPVPPQFRDKGPRAAGEKREEDPKTLPDVLRAIQRRHPTISLESSTSRDRVTILFRTPYNLPPLTAQTPPLVRAAHALAPEERILRARLELLTRVTRKIEKTILVPAVAKAFVVGPKGKVLRMIVESTGASVSVPPKESDDETELVPITIAGEESAVLDAEERIRAIVRERTNKLSAKLESIPSAFYARLDGPDPDRSELSELARLTLIEKHGLKEEDVNCRVQVPALDRLGRSGRSHFCLADDPEAEDETGANADPAIVVSGEREQVEVVLKLIQTVYDDFIRKTTKVEFELPKRQHRFLDAPTILEILTSTGSVVSLPPSNDPSEKVVVRGEKMANVQALGMVMTAANTKEVESLDLRSLFTALTDAESYARQLITYLATKSAQPKLRQIQESFKGKVQIYVPLPLTRGRSIEFVGEQAELVAKAKEAMAAHLTTTLKPECFEAVPVDYLLHRHLTNKKNVKLRTMLDQRGVELIIPPEQERSSTVLLVATRAAKAAEGVKKVKEEILRIVKELANIQTREFEIEERWHSFILGPNRTTLNAVIGEEKLVSVDLAKDLITIRGTKDEVERVEKELKRIGEEAKVNATINSFKTEFEVESKHVSHLVGKGGSTIAKLREELGVRVDFGDQTQPEIENGQSNVHRKKRTGGAIKVSIMIEGRKENVEEAKKRILAQTERLADEVSVSIPILAGVDRRSLVGKGGKYFTRLQDLHLVHINMPRSQSDEPGASVSDGGNKIVIRGPKKGVDAVKKELIELMDYEKEHGNTLTLSVPTKSIARIVGKGGATADRIKEESGITALDIDKGEATNGISQVVMRGTKQAIGVAKKMVNAIAAEVEDEDSVEMVIEKPFHQSLIGKGGAKLRELVKRAGGDDEDAKRVRFPRSHEQGQAGEVVYIKGSKKLVPKIKAELEAELARLKAQVVIGVRINRNSQPGLIGRGASGLKALEKKFGVAVYAPGWRDWATAPEPINAAEEELKGVDSAEIFKVFGTKEACLSAAQEMKSKTVLKERVSEVTVTVNVPKAIHHQVSQNGRFFREQPKSIRIDHGQVSTPAPFQVPSSLLAGVVDQVPTTRIDVEEDASSGTGIGWSVVEIPEPKTGDEEGMIPWNIHGPSNEEVEKVAKVVQDRVKKAEGSAKARPSHLAIAKVPSQSMARIIGRGGSGLMMLSTESGGGIVDVIGKSGSDKLSVVGSLEQLEVIRKILSRIIDQ